VAKDIGNIDPTGIIENAKGQRLHDFMSRCSFQFPHVVYIMGNHEHYHGDYAESAKILREFCAEWSNVHFLDKELVKIDDVTFIGGTLWTDMNGEDELTMRHIAGMMNDFRIVKNSKREVNYKTFDAGSDNPTFRRAQSASLPAKYFSQEAADGADFGYRHGSPDFRSRPTRCRAREEGPYTIISLVAVSFSAG
jgi:hypothetical protein